MRNKKLMVSIIRAIFLSSIGSFSVLTGLIVAFVSQASSSDYVLQFLVMFKMFLFHIILTLIFIYFSKWKFKRIIYLFSIAALISLIELAIRIGL